MARNLTQPEMIRTVSMFLDNELNQDAQNTFKQQLDRSPELQQVLFKEQQIRDIIKSKAQRCCSPDLIDSIREKIRIAPA